MPGEAARVHMQCVPGRPLGERTKGWLQSGSQAPRSPGPGCAGRGCSGTIAGALLFGAQGAMCSLSRSAGPANRSSLSPTHFLPTSRHRQMVFLTGVIRPLFTLTSSDCIGPFS